MLKEYVPKRKNPYWLPQGTYRLMKQLLNEYPNLRKKSSCFDVVVEAVKETLRDMEAKYGVTYTGEPFDAYKSFFEYGIFCYYRTKKKAPTVPSERTWKRYKSEVAWTLARKLNYV